MSHPAPPRRPASVTALCAALAAGVAAAQAPERAAVPPTTTAPAEGLPAAKVLIEQALGALGGRPAIAGIETMRYQIVAHHPAGAPATYQIRSARGARLLAEGKSTGGTIVMGRNGDVGWQRKPAEYELWPADRVGPDILGYLFVLVDPATKMRTVDRGPFADADCWKLEITDPEGDSAFAYFEVAGGLLRGIEVVREVGGAERITRTTFDAYQEVPPLRLFTKATMVQVDGASLARFDFSEVSFNTVPESDFEIPAEVLALLEAEKQKKLAAATQPETKEGETATLNPQMQRLLDRLKEMDDVAQLELIAGFLEGRLDKEDVDRASMVLVIEKIRERIADIATDAPKVASPPKTGGGEDGKGSGAAGGGR